MKAWHFSETAYPYLPPDSEYPSIRVTLPNSIYDPKKGAALYDRYIDEWLCAEDEGMGIMVNEHHATATCVDPAAPLLLAGIARQSSKARLLILGNPIANRKDPIRVAEEMAMLDILSHGRLEAGFVRGIPYEIVPTNSKPVYMHERHWEALDLIVKAWTTHDGPFSHEGRFFHQRSVNIWPRCYQDPHPPVWVTSTSPPGAAAVASRGFVQATFLTGFDLTRKIFDGYRKGWRDAGRGNDVPINRLAYAALVYVGENETMARAGADKLLWYLKTNKVAPQFTNPPGYLPVDVSVRRMQTAASSPLGLLGSGGEMTVEKAIAMGMMFAGTPDQVVAQVKEHYARVGGYGHLLNMGQAGFLENDETKYGIRMFAREVLPRLNELFPDAAISGAE